MVSGPTAVGKSALGLDLCLRLGGEIISADSVQVYRGLDVGSNKATLSERMVSSSRSSLVVFELKLFVCSI